jgi:hypothetical protein
MLRFSIRDLLWLTLVVALGIGWWTERLSHDAATNVGDVLTLNQAQNFHLQIQETLPPETTLKLSGFPLKKWTKGIEPSDRLPQVLGSWLASDYSDKTRPSPMLDITLLLDPKGGDAKWRRFGVRIEVVNEPNPKATAMRATLLDELK